MENVIGELDCGRESPSRIAVVGVKTPVGERLRALSSVYPDFQVVADLRAGGGAVRELARVEPDIVLIEDRLPDADALSVCDRIHRHFRDAALILISEGVTESMTLLAVEAGACGMISPLAPDEDLVLAVLRAAEGEFLLPKDAILRLFRRERELRHQALGLAREPA